MSTTQTTRVTAEPALPFVDVVREFNAPAERVYHAHTDPALYAQWVGPAKYTTAIEHFDARSGGAYRFSQTGPDGERFAFHGSFHELTAPSRMVQTFEFEGAPGHVSLDISEIENLDGGRCRLTVHSTFQSVEDRDAMLAAGMTDGMNEGYDRLDGILASGAA
ncbi:SRPBCC family protein [Sinomonas notoginsengisoli]|uniref:SRPBCC family protein n=1 Tax=Sinomonas notoginsengisoli TaxID=1457311 RepID=UPI001F15D999|nr:SRPBCC family protein [Sinomonas notoginsengisoli]